MPNCPACYKEFTKRKDGACPLCLTPLGLYEGTYYRAELGSPSHAIFSLFEDLVSEQTSQKQGIPVRFHISKKTNAWKREQAVAQQLLKQCDNDLEWTLTTLYTLFHNKQFAHKTRSSLLHCTRDWPLAMAIAKAVIDQRIKKEQEAERALDQLKLIEDVWE